MRNVSLVVMSAALALAGSTGCATKGFVKSNVAEASDEINGRIDGVSRSLEETQEATRQNAARINDVDQKAAAADEKAGAAGRTAQAAQSAADAAMSRADEVDRASKKLVYEVVLSEAQGNFTFGRSDLSDDMKTEIDRLVERLKGEPVGLFIEIEGHTDSTGPEEVNQRIGMERAEAVKRYLYEQHQIPLHKMNVISYGEEQPVAPNDTRQGRAQNRRVVIKVLA